MNAMFENLHWTIVHWRSKDVDNTLKAYQLYLQTAIETEATASLNNFRFKYIFWKKKTHGLVVQMVEEIKQFVMIPSCLTLWSTATSLIW